MPIRTLWIWDETDIKVHIFWILCCFQIISTLKVFTYVCFFFLSMKFLWLYCSKRNVWIEHDFPQECHSLYLLIFYACFYLDTVWCCELFHFSGIYSWKSGSAINNRTCYGESIHICEGMYSNLDVFTFLNFHVDFWIQIVFSNLNCFHDLRNL